jgi:hypothetical protein
MKMDKTTKVMIISSVVIAFLIIVIFMQYYKQPVSLNCTDVQTLAYKDGVGQGLNLSVQALLYYSQNCSIATINYSNSIYGFVDVHCIKEGGWK